MNAPPNLTDPTTADPPQTVTVTAADPPLTQPGPEAGGERPPALGRRIFRPQTLLSFAIAFAALYFFFRQSSNLNLADVWAHLRRARIGVLILAFAVYYSSFIFRSLRWETLLANVGYSRQAGWPMPSTVRLGEILYVSWFANCVTPARLGDAYRGYLLKRAAGVSFTVTLGTILAERLVDVTVLAVLMGAATLATFGRQLPPEATRALVGGLVLAAVGLGGLVSLRRLRSIVDRLLPARFLKHYAGFETGVLGSLRRIPLLVALSAIGWGIEGATLYLTAAALGASLSFVSAIVVALVAALLTAVPFTPAGLGVTEAGMILVLTRLGLDANTAGAVALLNRAINYWSIIIIGFVLYLYRAVRDK